MRSAKPLGQYTVFGWLWSRMALPAGASYSYILPADIPRSKLPAISYWVKGLVAGRNLTTLNDIAERRPGVLTSELSETVLAGRFVLTAQEDSEWWCVAAKSNDGKLPRMQSLAMLAGEIVDTMPGQNVMVCAGELLVAGEVVRPGQGITITQPGTMIASMPTRALYIEEPRA